MARHSYVNADMSLRAEIRSLTGIRGAAAIWVMVFHTIHVLHPSTRIRVFINNGYLAVDLFFILSGYIIALNYGRSFSATRADGANAVHFLRQRIARTYPLYFCFTLVTFFMGSIGWAQFVGWPTQTCSGALPANLLLLQTWHTRYCSLDPPGWSISAEWGAYLLFPLLAPAILGGSRLRLAVVIGGAIAAVTLVGQLPTNWLEEDEWRLAPLAISNGHTFAPGILCLAEFVLGIAVYRISQSQYGLRLSSNGAASIWLSLVIAALCFTVGADVALVPLFALLIWSLSADRGPIAAVLGWGPIYFLGVISYSIYLVHYPILLLAKNLGGVFTLDATIWSATIVISTLTYYGIERPGRRVLSRPPGGVGVSRGMYGTG